MEQHKLEVNTIYRLFYDSTLLRNNLHTVKPQILKYEQLEERCQMYAGIYYHPDQNTKHFNPEKSLMPLFQVI